MVVRIRLARPPGHTKSTTQLHLVAVNARKARDAKPLEVLGVYDPVPRLVHDGAVQKKMEWSVERIRYWLGVGAQPSKPVVRLLSMARLIPPDAKYKGISLASSTTSPSSVSAAAPLRA
ncbi:hypothetical protein BOTBODRAFT_137676 [Botryobasidium botryosum FD-172 SS1]|uniref:Ribosomal protein S16 n=1 Tax=Botryobasidium botryosum (strain FD-172 SS1) TaxID=930990 RepID=A0A067M1B1_BOTB1|nr:hypothetical protein BOTBODRAFT_137676 [Botryobasidium botryosum FD-172 SS1]